MKASVDKYGRNVLEFKMEDWRLAGSADEDLEDIGDSAPEVNCKLTISNGEISLHIADLENPENEALGQDVVIELGRTQYDDEPKREGAVLIVRAYDDEHETPLTVVIPKGGPIEVIDKEYQEEHRRLLHEEAQVRSCM